MLRRCQDTKSDFIPSFLHNRVIKDNSEIPAGVPDHLVSFPGHYGGIPLHKDNLREVTEVSWVMDGDVFVVIEPRVRKKCLQL